MNRERREQTKGAPESARQNRSPKIANETRNRPKPVTKKVVTEKAEKSKKWSWWPFGKK